MRDGDVAALLIVMGIVDQFFGICILIGNLIIEMSNFIFTHKIIVRGTKFRDLRIY